MAIQTFAFDSQNLPKSFEAECGDATNDYWTDLKLAFPTTTQVTILAGSRFKIGTYFNLVPVDEQIDVVNTVGQTTYFINVKIDYTSKTATFTQSSEFASLRDFSGVSEYSIMQLNYYSGNAFDVKYFEPLYDRVDRVVIWTGNSKINSTDKLTLNKDLYWFKELIFESSGSGSPIIKSSAIVQKELVTTNAFTGFTLADIAETSATITFNKYIKQASFNQIQGSTANEVAGSPPITKIIGVYNPLLKNPDLNEVLKLKNLNTLEGMRG
jgi:hypothetical protein